MKSRPPLVFTALCTVVVGLFVVLPSHGLSSRIPPKPDNQPTRPAGNPPRRSDTPSAPVTKNQTSNVVFPADLLSRAPADPAAATARLVPHVLDSKLPASGRSEALSHLLNLAAGRERDTILPLLRDEKLPFELCQTILDDALNRSPAWQAEAYLAALGAREEPELRARIRRHLGFLTSGPDFGDSPEDWRNAWPKPEASNVP